MSPLSAIHNYILRHVQVMLFSLGQLWRQPFASLMTVTVIGIALALPAGLYILLKNTNSLSEQWDDSHQITLYLQQDISYKQADDLVKQLHSWPDIKEVVYQTAEQSLSEFRQLSGLGDLLDSLPDNPLPAIIVVYPDEHHIRPDAIGSLLSRLEHLPNVELAQLDMEWLQRFRSITTVLYRGLIILAVLLSLSVLLIIGNTIRLAIVNRHTEIKIMKLVGATNRFVRRPFLYTGFWYGALGGLSAWFILLLTMLLISQPITQLSEHYGSTFNLQWFSGNMLITLPVTGILIGVSGAWLAVSRHIHIIEPT